jgi:hypothetical protein
MDQNLNMDVSAQCSRVNSCWLLSQNFLSKKDHGLLKAPVLLGGNHPIHRFAVLYSHLVLLFLAYYLFD